LSTEYDGVNQLLIIVIRCVYDAKVCRTGCGLVSYCSGDIFVFIWAISRAPPQKVQLY